MRQRTEPHKKQRSPETIHAEKRLIELGFHKDELVVLNCTCKRLLASVLEIEFIQFERLANEIGMTVANREIVKRSAIAAVKTALEEMLAHGDDQRSDAFTSWLRRASVDSLEASRICRAISAVIDVASRRRGN